MKNTTNNDLESLQKSYLESLQNMTEVTVNAYRSFFDGLIENNNGFIDTSQIKIPGIQPSSSNCCAPQQQCPPNCITEITRRATPNERVIIPLLIRNTCSTNKLYKVGVRELKDVHGENAPSQPSLNKEVVNLNRNESESVLMMIDLRNFQIGKYQVEVVLREKEFNQNICLTLIVEDYKMHLAKPIDEKRYKKKWKSWQSHFYCEPNLEQKKGEQ